MRYALPIVLLVCLAALLTISPQAELRHLRTRASQLTAELRRIGFGDGSRASWSQACSTGWPPFHYGRRGEFDHLLLGALHGLPVRVAGYETTFNGSRHRYGLALLVLPRPVEWIEVRGEQPFSAARVPEHVPDGQLTLELAEFDAAWSVYAQSPASQRAAAESARLAQNMLHAPAPFSWRTQGSELLLWKRDGWSDSAQLLASVDCVASVLSMDRLDFT